ncbi:MAG TPA: hypothetical protein VLC50_00645 [Actinomycetes bacterium]|nr:hypothetical protein [Actinomycetes bacterium]
MALTSTDPASGEDARAGLERELRRTCDRVATLTLARLTAAAPAADSPADRVRETAQRLVEVAAGIEAREAPSPPVPRGLPTLRAHALADQLAVTGTDVLLVAAGLPDEASVWDHAVRRPLAEALAGALEAVVALRRALP